MKSWSSFSQELTEKKANKDYDGDGKVESGSKEHAGVVHNAIQRAKGKKADGQDTRKEELEIEEGKYSGSKSHIQRDGTASAPERTAAERKKDRRILAGYGKGGMKDAVERAKKERDEKRKARMKKEEVELQELDIKGAVTGALDRGSKFMKKNPVGRAVSDILKPVGSGRGTARPSVRTQNTIRQNQQSQMNSFEPEGDQIDEFLAGKPGDGYIGHPNLDIKNPLAKKQVKKPVLPGSKGGGPVNRVGATIGDRNMRLKNMLNQSHDPEGEMVEEGKKELSREKRNKMFRRAGNLSREALQGGDKGSEAHKKSGKIVKALNKDAEENNRNDVREGYDKPDEKLKTGRKMFTIPDEERSAAAARLKEKARKKRESSCKKEEVETPVVEEAESKAQQRLMGLALSVKRGDTPMSSVTPQVARMAREMKEKDLKDFAGTKHDGLPEKVKKEEPEVSSPLVESLVESAVQRMVAKARRETDADKRLNRQASSAQQRAELNAKK